MALNCISVFMLLSVTVVKWDSLLEEHQRTVH